MLLKFVLMTGSSITLINKGNNKYYLRFIKNIISDKFATK